MVATKLIAPPGQTLQNETVLAALHQGLDGYFHAQKVLVLIPDHTRSVPLPFLFRALVEILQDARQLDFMVALGTHPALIESDLDHLLGISLDERRTVFRHVGLINHVWNNPLALARLGTIPQEQVQALAGEFWHPSLAGDIEVKINKAALEYDHILILGPTFPHEVAGFSGGAKYLFPGISGPEMINASHWLGALTGVVGTIGMKDTPVRNLINIAAGMLEIPVTLVGLVVERPALSGLFIGDILSAWSAAADLSAQRHIQWVDRPFQRVLSCAPAMYDELWTASKAMYKLEPAVAVGGEVVIYAPHLEVVSRVHGRYIFETGYHILPYYLANWDRYRHIPLGVLAHSTHLRGSGHMEGSIERPNVKVTLASKIPPEDCARLNLGYLDPARINIAEWQNRAEKGILYVPHAGEILYRVQSMVS
ncbi:MAG: lactate racemase domain-containing protein [Anaerolineales bacterium]|jgi:nickel-dependent lactate racemase